MNSAEEFSKTMFGEKFTTNVPIEKVDNNSSFIGVLNFKSLFLIILYNFEIIKIIIVVVYTVPYRNLQLESCPKWTHEIHDSEASMFRKSPEYMNMVSQISKRLGFLDNITDSEYTTDYQLCIYGFIKGEGSY